MVQLWQGISHYLAARAPKEWEKAELRRYRERLHNILSAEHRLVSFYQNGSFQLGTAVTPYSGGNYVARIHFEDQPNSSRTGYETFIGILTSPRTHGLPVSQSVGR